LDNQQDGRTYRWWFQDSLFLGSLKVAQNYSHELTCLAGRIFGVSFVNWSVVSHPVSSSSFAPFWFLLLSEGFRSALIAHTTTRWYHLLLLTGC